MVSRMPPTPLSSTASHLIPSEILKGLKFKQRSRDRHCTRFVGKFLPLVRHSPLCICEI